MNKALNKLNTAIHEARQIAGETLDALNDLNSPTVSAAFTPLFKPEDVGGLKTIFSLIQNADTNDLQIFVYCAEDHMRWSDKRNMWYDNAYKYKDKKGITQSIKIYFKDSDTSNTVSPGQKGSYTSHGYRVPIGAREHDVADCSNQAHIFVHPTRIDPPAGTKHDHRPLGDIRAFGLKEGFTALQDLKPLAETILHEVCLFHIIFSLMGGLRDPKKPNLKITDGANPGIYGYEKCAAVNAGRGLLSPSPTGIADCYVVLAKALFLRRIQQKDVFWSLGAVKIPDEDGDKFEPIDIPGEQQRKRLASAWWG
ncbi:hypothetical protein DL765_002472 [Monosporascus sp. GIB2]|nr:hypothetical protein DL765_002472 [Monosporascus sp. GIB2]